MTNWSLHIPENQLPLHQHVIRTLLYYDIFNYPLKINEVFRFLGMNTVTESDVAFALNNLEQKGAIYRISEYYCIKPAEDYVRRRIKGNKTAESFLEPARRQALLIASFPFVRGVLVSGSLSKGYMDEESDLDFFVITAPDRLWIARTLLVLYKWLFLFNSHKLFCVNYFVDEDHPQIEEKNLFTATELATVIPLYGSQQYQLLIGSNVWLKGFFPNFKPHSTSQVPTSASTGIKKVMEVIINTLLPSRVERCLRKMTLMRWQRIYKQHYSSTDFDIAFKSEAYASKNHPKNYQRKILDIYADRLRSFELNTVVLQPYTEQMTKV